MQEEEQKTNVPIPTPRTPVASGKSGSARKKLKYSRRLKHTTPKKREHTALFLRLGVPSTLIRHENGAGNHSSIWRKLKTPSLRFSVDRKHFENETFRKR